MRLLPPVQDKPPNDQPLRVQFAVINAGTGSGWVTGSAVHLQYLFEFEKPHLPELLENGVIARRHYGVGASDNSVIVQSDRQGWLNHEEATADHLGESHRPVKTLYFSGWLTYGEASGHVRTTYFRRIWSYHEECFIPSADPDDEKTY